MGGYGSGRQYGRPTADASRRIDLAWMMRKDMVRAGNETSGTIYWNSGGNPAGSISYRADMRAPEYSNLFLTYTREEGHEQEEVKQAVRLVYTEPNFGGKRWWMICPYNGSRIGKLYLPPQGDRFASRGAWKLGYHSQRIPRKDAIFERLFRLQKKLGCQQGWGNYPTRPKGMHKRTYDRLLHEFDYLDDLCSVEMMAAIGLIQRLDAR